ncbi:MAG: type III-A CRISPR-associated RAMP protein Csm4 [Bacteroidota bacterium]|nr:type III-A CRISPR-associated RAMP protein Csm4 [Bacteroidota bacterium]
MATLSFELVKLKFTSPLHLSRGQTDFYDKSETIIHSDTIKSALFSCAKVLFQESITKDFLESFLISSAFPFNEDDYFFPKPISDIPLRINDIKGKAKENKKLKKLDFLNKYFFEKTINADEFFDVSKNNFSKNGKFLVKENQQVNIFESEVQQRLVMPKGEEDNPTPYYVDRLFFRNNTGLYFLLKANDNKIRNVIIDSLELLSQQGIGTDRNVGNGQFDFELVKDFKINVPDKSNSQMTLSLFLPQNHEISDDTLKNSRYQLLKRGGYISSPENMDILTFRKKSVYMFKEASVFPLKKLQGKILDLKPDNVQGLNHEIWRDGKAIFIPLKIISNDKS